MPQEPEEQQPEPLDIQRYLALVNRRYPYFLIALFAGWFLVWGASWILPVSYKSATLILVEQPTMPKDYVTPNVNEDLQGRLQNITQQILSRTRLLHIIDDTNLYSDGQKQATPDDKVERMRKDIKIELVRGPQDQITAFTISFSARDPHIAQHVTSELTNLFIHENLEVRQQQSQDTTEFLEKQLESARHSLAEQEAKIREFKGSREGDLPSQQATNLQILNGLQLQLDKEQESLNTAQQQRVYLQTMVGQYRGFRATSTSADGTPTGLAVIDKQLEALKSQLAVMNSQYTDQYPGIRSLKGEIAKTEKTRTEMLADLKSKGGASAGNSSGAAHEAIDSPQSSQLLQLQGQVQFNQAEIKSREEAIAALKAKVNDYQARLNKEPETEQQLADLTRGYDQSKANYDDLLKKESGSQMATSMEQMQQGERFRVLDPPSLPTRPDFPNRLKFCGIALGFGLVLGIVVAGAIEFLDDRMYNDRQIKALLPMKVIAEIPEITSPADQLRSHRRSVLGWVMAAIVFAAILAGSAVSYRVG
jgi:succinoglycan biosynthesis transport protein ExoP